MLPVFVIVGGPNKGKSTLFNGLTHTNQALVADVPGVTRDRQYGRGQYDQKPFIVVDTGGLCPCEQGALITLSHQQTQQAIKASDKILWMVDAKVGLTSEDRIIGQQLREFNKPILLLINKIDGLNPKQYLSEFAELGIPSMHYIAAAHQRGLAELMKTLLQNHLAVPNLPLNNKQPQCPRLVVLGRPNVGKSTLVNHLLKEERMVVTPTAGTTQDAIETHFIYAKQAYCLVDTPGIRRRSRVHDTVEKYSVIKSLQAIENSDVVILLLDTDAICSQQDLRLLRFVIESGKAFVIVVNKVDKLPAPSKHRLKHQVEDRLSFAPYADKHYVSAKMGTGIKKMMQSVKTAYHSTQVQMSTYQLNQILQVAVGQHEPPKIQGRRIKLRYVHIGGRSPLSLVVHGKQTKKLPASYKRYLLGHFRKAFNLRGVPLSLILRDNPNPYKPSL